MLPFHKILAYENAIDRALARLDRVIRLASLGAPANVLDKARALFARSLEELGENADKLAELYPEFAIRARMAEARDRAWEARCERCIHWRGLYGLVDPETEVGDRKPWCTQYDFDNMSQPEPCPKFRSWEPN